MSCHPFHHDWEWDSDIEAERCMDCNCLGEENEYGHLVTIKCETCGAWASHYHEGEWCCQHHGRKKKGTGLRGVLLDD